MNLNSLGASLSDKDKKLLEVMRPSRAQLEKLLAARDEYHKPHHGKYGENDE